MTTRDPRTWMWAQACELLEQADRLHRQFFQLGRFEATRPTWEPPVDIFEAEGEIRILVALPGVPSERVEVLIDGGWLIVAGDRPVSIPSPASVIHRLEIPHGRFERHIKLPPYPLEMVMQDLVDGCLVLGLRKLG